MTLDPSIHPATADEIAPIVRGLVAAHGGEVSERDVWLVVRPAGATLAAHGWKLHLSARPGNLRAIVERAVPVLLDHGVPFKLARTVPLLIRINSGTDSPAAVGKAFTVYPGPDQVASLGRRLAELLRGFDGPRVVSDRRVCADAPVYYRYGPFQADWRADEFGTLRSQILGPDGQRFDGLADLSYRQPSWVADPFGEPIDLADPADLADRDSTVIADRYRVVGGVQRSVRGSVYRGIRLADDQPVIIKQARAFVGEDHAGVDARLRLRNERLVLTRLADVAGVPRFIDHLQAGPDELLVLSDEGPQNLVDQLTEHGRYRDQRLRRLATELAGIVREVHRAGVLIRDLSPKNVLVPSDESQASGGVRIVDFGIAASDGIVPAGFTSGYSPPAQRRQEPPEPWHDCHALAMTLLFAMTGLDPVVVDDDWARTRALETLSVQGDPLGLAGLLDPATAESSLTRIANGSSRPSRTNTTPPTVDTELAAEIANHLLVGLLDQARVLLTRPDRVRVDASIHRGLAGLGLELLHHLDQDGVPEIVTGLAELTADNAGQVGLPPGLYVGTTGIEIFLSTARRSGLTDRGVADTREPTGFDLMLGTAGVGLGQLLHYDLTGDRAALATAGATANRLLAQGQTPPEASADPARTGVDPSCGLAHGQAGPLLLLSRLAVADPTRRPQALAAADALLDELPRLLDLAALSGARPLAVSWCQGLTGVARALFEVGQTFNRADLIDASVQATQVCLDWVPRLATVGQCCGITGIGGLLLQLAPTRAAHGLSTGVSDVSRQLLLRSAGPANRPRFDIRFGADDISWGYGQTGLLAYFRSVRDREQRTDAFSAVK